MKTEIKILAIETASEACSATLLISDANDINNINNISKSNKNDKVYEQIELTPRQHAKKILSMLDTVLKDGGLELDEVDAIAFGRGPGAFTGLRIATGIAQGVSLSIDKPVVPVSTLAALALEGVFQSEAKNETEEHKNTIFAAALDARMGEVYWGLFKLNEGNIELLGEEQVSKPEIMLQSILKTADTIENCQILAIGAGWDAYQEALFKLDKPKNLDYIENIFPTASSIAKLALPLFKNGETVVSEDAQPVYIRNDVAKKSQKQKLR
jgi:tRNA threonylcarbamoyladenosine biosynthesis protein TsaB